MKLSTVAALLASFLKHRKRALLVGPPGIGKSQVVEQAAQSLGYPLAIWHPVVCDPTDFRGLPWKAPNNGHASFLPFGDLCTLIEAKEPLVAFFDDIGPASRAVQAAVMQLLLTGRIGDHAVSEHVRFIAATNRAQDKAGVSGILQPLQSRFHGILNLEVDLEDWCDWALGNGMPTELIAFIRMRPGMLHDWKPLADIKAQPTPRTWEFAGEILGLRLPAEHQTQALIGCVGEAAAGELVTFLKLAKDERVDLDKIMQNPQTCQIPDEAGLRYVIATGLSRVATQKNMPAIATVMNRLQEAGAGDFAMLCLRDAIRRDHTLEQTAAWTELMTGPVGNLLSPGK